MTRAQGETPEDRLLRDLESMDGTGRLPEDRAQGEGQEKPEDTLDAALDRLGEKIDRLPDAHSKFMNPECRIYPAPVAIPDHPALLRAIEQKQCGVVVNHRGWHGRCARPLGHNGDHTIYEADPPVQEKTCEFLHQPLPVADPPVPRGQEERRQLIDILDEHCYKTDDLVASFRSLARHKRNLELTCQSAGIAVGIDGRALDTPAPVAALAQAEGSLKLKTATESVGWLNTQGPLTTSPQVAGSRESFPSGGREPFIRPGDESSDPASAHDEAIKELDKALLQVERIAADYTDTWTVADLRHSVRWLRKQFALLVALGQPPVPRDEVIGKKGGCINCGEPSATGGGYEIGTEDHGIAGPFCASCFDEIENHYRLL